jgi:hypothetical protein
MSGIVSDNIDRQSGVIAEPSGGAEVRSDDPSASAGTVWFNTTSGVLKVYRTIAAWSAEAAITVAKDSGMGFGTPSAAMVAGGTSDGNDFVTTTYEWNGSAWSTGGVMANAGWLAMCFGSQTSAYTHGGYNSHSGSGGWHQNAEEYNGTSWSSATADYTIALKEGNALGATETAGLAAGGRNTSNSMINTCKSYNGSSWSAENARQNSVYDSATAGTTTAGMMAGGYNSGHQNHGEEWDGTSWANSGDLGTARSAIHTGQCGTQASAMVVSGVGGSGRTVTTEIYNGSTFAAGTSISVAVQYAQIAANSNTDVLHMGGDSSAGSSQTTNQSYAETVTARTVTDS